MDKLLLTPEDAAVVLSIGRSKLYELLATGELRSVRIGTSRRIPAEEVAAYVQRLARADRSEPQALDPGSAA
ncbi:MAG: helix-turn-helix domain-containing protein [Nocardioidaceae bacterium]